MVLGILDFGMLFWRYESVTNAAREGARVAILPGYSATDVQLRVEQYITDAGLSAMPVTTVVAPVGVNIGGGTCITLTGATVSYHHDYFWSAPWWATSAAQPDVTSLNATSMMRYEGAALACP